MITRLHRTVVGMMWIGFLAIVVGVWTPNATSAQARLGTEAPELFKSAQTFLEPESKIVATLQVEDDWVYFVEYKGGNVDMIAMGPKAARALSVLKHVYNYSNLEIFEALGGRREEAPQAFLEEYQAKYRDDLTQRTYPSMDEVLSYGGVVYGSGTDCNPDENPCGPDGGYMKAGLLATSVNICDEDYNFETWENYLGSNSFQPWVSPYVSDPLDELGTQGAFGKGKWRHGNANITIPPTQAGGMVVCNRNFTGDGPTIIVQEELFPGAWFHHWQTEFALPGYVYGIVFDLPVTRHSIRVLIRDFEDQDVDGHNVFWWGGAY